jgi:hypothetical protein
MGIKCWYILCGQHKFDIHHNQYHDYFLQHMSSHFGDISVLFCYGIIFKLHLVLVNKYTQANQYESRDDIGKKFTAGRHWKGSSCFRLVAPVLASFSPDAFSHNIFMDRDSLLIFSSLWGSSALWPLCGFLLSLWNQLCFRRPKGTIKVYFNNHDGNKPGHKTLDGAKYDFKRG